MTKDIRIQKWYFGGLSSAGAAVCTHPLDLIKVHLQTHHGVKMKVLPFTMNIIRNQGFFSLYNGLSASLLRQLTYSTTRFGVYEVAKQIIEKHYISNDIASTKTINLPFYVKLSLAAFAGFCGGIVGSPADMINVRMQNDIKLPLDKRRNYKHAIDGLVQVKNHEGFLKLWSGVSMATSRGVFMTVGQLAFYDQIKQLLTSKFSFPDTVATHITSSTLAATIATTLTQPLDVLKTRMMNAKPGEYKGLSDCAIQLAKLGPMAFYKGYIPAFIRLAPHTVLTFVFLEQLRLNFGTLEHQKTL